MRSNTANESLKVREIMRRPVVASHEEDSVRSVAAKMRKHGIGSVVIVNRTGKATGIITQGDIVRRLVGMQGARLQSMKAAEIMSKPLKFISLDERIEDAAKAMVDYRVKRLCVMDEKKRLVGIVSDNDVMRNTGYMMDVFNELIDIRHPSLESDTEPEEFVLAEAEGEDGEE